MVCCGLPVGRDVGHHAPSIRLGHLDFSIALSFESHRHIRITMYGHASTTYLLHDYHRYRGSSLGVAGLYKTTTTYTRQQIINTPPERAVFRLFSTRLRIILAVPIFP
jgi:hypothetical protein